MVQTLTPPLPAAQLPPRRLPAGWQWPALVVALLALPVVFGGWLVREATRDSSLQAEGDYYRRALDWDRQQANRRRLGWQVQAPPMPVVGGPWRLQLRDADGRPLRGAVVSGQLVHLSMNAMPVCMRATETTPGSYVVTLPPRTRGWHRVQLDITRENASLNWSQRVEAVP